MASSGSTRSSAGDSVAAQASAAPRANSACSGRSSQPVPGPASQRPGMRLRRRTERECDFGPSQRDRETGRLEPRPNRQPGHRPVSESTSEGARSSRSTAATRSPRWAATRPATANPSAAVPRRPASPSRRRSISCPVAGGRPVRPLDRTQGAAGQRKRSQVVETARAGGGGGRCQRDIGVVVSVAQQLRPALEQRRCGNSSSPGCSARAAVAASARIRSAPWRATASTYQRRGLAGLTAELADAGPAVGGRGMAGGGRDPRPDQRQRPARGQLRELQQRLQPARTVSAQPRCASAGARLPASAAARSRSPAAIASSTACYGQAVGMAPVGGSVAKRAGLAGAVQLELLGENAADQRVQPVAIVGPAGEEAVVAAEPVERTSRVVVARQRHRQLAAERACDRGQLEQAAVVIVEPLQQRRSQIVGEHPPEQPAVAVAAAGQHHRRRPAPGQVGQLGRLAALQPEAAQQPGRLGGGERQRLAVELMHAILDPQPGQRHGRQAATRYGQLRSWRQVVSDGAEDGGA